MTSRLPFALTLPLVIILHLALLTGFLAYRTNKNTQKKNNTPPTTSDQTKTIDPASIRWFSPDDFLATTIKPITSPPNPTALPIPTPLKPTHKKTSPPTDPSNILTPSQHPQPLIYQNTTASNDHDAATAAYDRLVHDAFRRPWIVARLNLEPYGRSLHTKLLVEIKPDGDIAHYEIVRTSGNDTMDTTVLAIARKIHHIAPLPPELGNANYEVILDFEFK